MNSARQISFELHLFPPSAQGNPAQPALTPPEMLANEGGRNFLHPTIELFRKFDARGYQVASSEYNYNSIAECCAEFTLVRG
jgi:hypothetical protein